MARSLPVSSLWARRAPKDATVAEIYKIKGLPRIGGIKTGGFAKYP